DLLDRVKQVSLGAYSHQDLPFELLVKELQPDRNTGHNPLFQVMFLLQSEEILPMNLPGLSVEHFRVDNQMATFDLTLDVVERDDRLTCLFKSNAELFEGETITRMMAHFETLLKAVVANPKQKIGALHLIVESERNR